MRSEWVPEPEVESWKGLGGRVTDSIGWGEVIAQRLRGTDDTFEQAVDSILAELRELMLRKHRDYGPLNIALAPGGAINGLRVRMHDKLARINNLTDKQAEPENESLQDSFGDLANYGIIGLMVLRGLWPGTETK